jgi:hypothetical protein
MMMNNKTNFELINVLGKNYINKNSDGLFFTIYICFFGFLIS